MANRDGPAVNENPIQNPNEAQGNAQDDNQEQNLSHITHSYLMLL